MLLNHPPLQLLLPIIQQVSIEICLTIFICNWICENVYRIIPTNPVPNNGSTANHSISLYPCYIHGLPLPPLQRMASSDSDWTPSTSMYSTETLLAETSQAQYERNTIQEIFTTCFSTIKPVELQCQPQNPHLYFLLSCIMQFIICHNQSICNPLFQDNTVSNK